MANPKTPIYHSTCASVAPRNCPQKGRSEALRPFETPLNLYDFAILVITTRGTNPMRNHQLTTMGTRNQQRFLQLPMRAPISRSRLGRLMKRNSHDHSPPTSSLFIHRPTGVLSILPSADLDVHSCIHRYACSDLYHKPDIVPYNRLGTKEQAAT